jgi:hypothetical protein
VRLTSARFCLHADNVEFNTPNAECTTICVILRVYFSRHNVRQIYTLPEVIGKRFKKIQTTKYNSIPGQSMWDLWWKKWHWDRFFPEFFGFAQSVSFHRCSITRKWTKKKIIIFIFITGSHNKPQGCSASVASAAGPLTTKKLSPEVQRNLILRDLIFSQRCWRTFKSPSVFLCVWWRAPHQTLRPHRNLRLSVQPCDKDD